jgi:hypothetical protein
MFYNNELANLLHLKNMDDKEALKERMNEPMFSKYNVNKVDEVGVGSY